MGRDRDGAHGVTDALTPLAHYVQRSHGKNVAVHGAEHHPCSAGGGAPRRRALIQYRRPAPKINPTIGVKTSPTRPVFHQPGTGVENFGQDRNYHSLYAENGESKRRVWIRRPRVGKRPTVPPFGAEQIMDAASYSASSSETTGAGGPPLVRATAIPAEKRFADRVQE